MILQSSPGARADEHVSLGEVKSPVVWMFVIVIEAGLTFYTVTDLFLRLAPMSSDGNVRLRGEGIKPAGANPETSEMVSTTNVAAPVAGLRV